MESQKIQTNENFVRLLNVFLEKLTARFPENQGFKSALSTISSVSTQSMFHAQIVAKWYDFSNDIYDEILKENKEVVCLAFSNSKNDMIRKMDVSSVFKDHKLDEATEKSSWLHLKNLTILARNLKSTEAEASMPKVPPQLLRSPTVSAAPELVRKAAAVSQKPKSTPGDIVGNITKAMPEVMKAFNDILKDDSGDNPLGQMIKGMMNPDGNQSGLMANIAQSALDNTPDTVLEQTASETGLTKNQLIYKLERLKILEARESKRKFKNNKKR